MNVTILPTFAASTYNLNASAYSPMPLLFSVLGTFGSVLTGGEMTAVQLEPSAFLSGE